MDRVVQKLELQKVRKLQLWQTYSRSEIHGIFSPDTTFTPQAGTWGLQGIVAIPGRIGDYVFYVTFGQSQGDHDFDESITFHGVLSWQSQPQQSFSSPAIKQLIAHDDKVNNIHLFLRSSKGAPYGYFGVLGYLTHDSEREKPVHFQWQLMSWPAPSSFIDNIGLNLVTPSEVAAFPEVGTHRLEEVVTPKLVFTPIPKVPARRSGVSTREFKTKKSPNYADIQKANTDLGLLGELKVLELERAALYEQGRPDLAEKVTHVSVVEGDGAGYDIRSFTLEGVEKYIEVKTTRGPANAPFFISPNELEFSKHRSDNYFLYRLYEWDDLSAEVKGFVLKGALDKQLSLQPTQYRAQVSV
jgi:hypothetical protein